MMLPAPNTYSSLILRDQTCQRFTLAEIQTATNNFDETLVIGRGGFGKVYKCSFKIGSLNEVAVKRLHSMSNQGSFEFEAEIEVLSKLRHGNLVSLIGYCNEEKEMVLVYEFMPNGTLEDHLHKHESSLSWLQRLKICIGTARGLDYLHTGTSTQHGVVHRDVKSSNILLDANFAAKISDFGLAKVGLIDHTQTYVSTAVKGTFGYMDPCYFYTGELTRKSDVYAFGVVLFEVLSRKKAVDSTLDEEQWGLAAWAQHQIKQGKLNQVVDSILMGQISKKCLKEFASIAAHCLHTQPKRRPTMAAVVVKLESILSQERERANSVIDGEGFIYKLRSLFIRKVDVAIGSKSDLTEIDDATRSQFDLLEVDVAIGSKSDLIEVEAAIGSKYDFTEVDAAIGSKSNLTENFAANKSNFIEVDAAIRNKSDLTDVATRSKSDLIEVEVAIGSKSDDAAIGSKSDFNLHNKPILITIDTAIESNSNKSFRAFTYEELASATSGFKYREHSPTLDEYIYKGWVDERTYAPTNYGVGLPMYVRKMEFITQKLNIKLEDFNHPNLVKFLGYCLSNHELFSVYEVISGITLDKYLYGDLGTTSLSWVARLKIAIAAAEGLFYFHKKNQTAYSQFKTNRILLDMDFNVRLSDFAFDAHTFQLDAYYAAPEWFRYQENTLDGRLPLQPLEDGFAIKNEIYAFGVVLLEILTGMKVYDDKRSHGKQNLLKLAYPLLANEVNLGMIMDPQLQHNNCPPKGAFKLAQLVSTCLQPKQEIRPSMEAILQILNYAQNEAVLGEAVLGEDGLKGQVPLPDDVVSPSGATYISIGGGGSSGGTFASRGGGFSSVRWKAAPIERILSCTLEELYKGTMKKINITRDVIDIHGKTMMVEEILTIFILPGWRKGTKVTFPGKGNEQPNITPADLIFIIQEKPHSTFTRDGNDLVVTRGITLVEALTGCTIHLTTLDGRNLTIPINNVILPEYEEVVPKEGMPISKDPTKRGDMRIKFFRESKNIRSNIESSTRIS